MIGNTDSWIKIPSKKSDKENYQKNLEKLKILSPRTWCSKNHKAEDYLSDYDIHIYYINNLPELGMRIKDGKVYDIVGFENNGKIPQNFLSIAEGYIKDNAFLLGYEAQDQIESAKYLKERIETVQKEIGIAIKNNNVYRIMNYFGFKPELLDDYTVSISYFRQPQQGKFAEFGIDENKLFEEISEIRGDVSLRDSKATSLGKVNKISGNINFSDSSISEAKMLEEVEGNIYFGNSKLIDLSGLKRVNGEIFYKNSTISLDELKKHF